MPHAINILTILATFFGTIYYWLFYQGLEQSVLISLIIPGYQLSNLARYRLMIRLIRVQVQLKSEVEKTKIIIKNIRRSKIIEYILFSLLIVVVACYVTFYLPNSLVKQEISDIFYYKISGVSSELFYLIFCYQMSKVNEQFHRLFKSIKVGSYPNKSIKAGLLILFCVFTVQNILIEII